MRPAFQICVIITKTTERKIRDGKNSQFSRGSQKNRPGNLSFPNRRRRRNVRSARQKAECRRLYEPYRDAYHRASVRHFHPEFRNRTARCVFRPNGVPNGTVLRLVKDTLRKICSYEGPVFGASEEECGNYRELDLAAAKKICSAYLKTLEALPESEWSFSYPN